MTGLFSDTLTAAAMFCAGALSGSFFRCIGERMAHGKDWIKGRSECNACGHRLPAYDLIPIISYLFLKGRCRFCGSPIPLKCLSAEILSGIYYLLALMRFRISVETLRCCVLSGLLLGISAADSEVYEIPDELILAGIGFWIMTVPFAEQPLRREVLSGLSGGLLIAGGMLGFSLIFEKITGTESLGGGDIKLLFMTGLFLGPVRGFAGLILSCVFGLLSAAVSGRSKIPFGPSISAAVCLMMLYGADIAAWYFRMLD